MKVKFQLMETHYHYTDWEVDLTEQEIEALSKLARKFRSYKEDLPDFLIGEILENLRPDLMPYNKVQDSMDYTWNGASAGEGLDNFKELLNTIGYNPVMLKKKMVKTYVG